VVVLTQEQLKNLKKKPIKLVKDLSNMLGYLINLKQKEKEVLPLILLFGNLKLQNIISLLLMLQVIEISLKI
jgi:hypothetical protein